MLDFFVTVQVMRRQPLRLPRAPSVRVRSRRPARRLGWLALACAAALGAEAQEPRRLGQDELDLQGRSSVVQGSGARALGMGGAFLARPDDATAASWNPSGLSYLRRPEVSLVRLPRNALATRERDARSLETTLTDERHGHGFDFVAGAYPIDLGSVSGAFQVSYQRVLAFDSTRTIERSNGTVTIESDGGFDVLALASGLQVSRRWRLGATLNRWFNGYAQTLDRQTAVNTRQTLRFDVAAWNVNLGLIWSPVESLNIGAVAKTPFTAKVSMARTRRDVTADVAETVTENSYSSDAVRLYLPGAIGVGASWRPRSTLTVSADYTRSLWSEAHVRGFYTLAACQPGQACPPARQPDATGDLFPHLTYPSLADPRQADTEEIRFGVERVLLFERAKVPLRAGFFRERPYFLRGDGTPPPRSLGITAGLGVVVGPLLLDAAYVRETLAYNNLAPVETERRRLRTVSEKVYLSLILRVP